MPRHRSPQRPAVQRIAFSPAASVLLTAASIPPVPEQVSVNTGCAVWKTYFRSSVTSARIAFASAARWYVTGLASSSSVSSGTGVGPGVNRRGFGIGTSG